MLIFKSGNLYFILASSFGDKKQGVSTLWHCLDQFYNLLSYGENTEMAPNNVQKLHCKG